MIGDSLTIENLQAIRMAMEKIKEIDRSAYFNQYYEEVSQRLVEAYGLHEMGKDYKGTEDKAIQALINWKQGIQSNFPLKEIKERVVIWHRKPTTEAT